MLYYYLLKTNKKGSFVRKEDAEEHTLKLRVWFLIISILQLNYEYNLYIIFFLSSFLCIKFNTPMFERNKTKPKQKKRKQQKTEVTEEKI